MIDVFRTLRWLASVAAVVGIAACRNLVDPDLPANAERFTPPSVYARWWAMTEACSGVTGNLSSVSWFVVPGASTVSLNGQLVDGYWSFASNRIVIAEAGKLAGAKVRHEMLHALLKGRGHPRGKFLADCGGVVTCAQVCISDAGPPPLPDPAAVSMPPDSLEIEVLVHPQLPNRAHDDGFFTITVSARNSRTKPVVVALPSGPFGNMPETFAFDVRGNGSSLVASELALDPSVASFAPGETKRHVFDFVIGNDPQSRAFPPGTYAVRGGYGGHWRTHPPLVLAP
ncbi:MAG: hypothetical protein M3O61_13375 [Gemmatimonadota bacterium]|nr:hypothetical protein [Gemmatimonadota bacterium]